MAELNRIEYQDYQNYKTEVIWFPVDAVGGEEIYYDYCGGEQPLRYRWYGERYSEINGSTVNINVLIQNDEDKAQIDKVLDTAYYIVIKKNNTVQWRGKMFPQLFTEVYKEYPYAIQLNGTDQLGQMKGYRPLMTDFPDPFNTIAPKYSVLDIINNFLTM